jgi:glycosyltransferase involved in cell wall biosynthesis
MNVKKCKIVMITMFKNESSVIKRMLESCLPFVDYYVMQNNGSTDGTDEIAKQFLIDNKLSGEIYEVEEGWVGFGWNRDHLIQYCQKTDHDCDWILKMDCDETLEVDDNFDWSLLDDASIQAFHIPAVSGTCIYHRAWMYNAKLPWRFNHDLCHETVYCEIPEIGLNFQRFDLPPSFRQVGTNEGQSWGVATKFISDSLKLEEELIREQTMLENEYHFWYLGKSYTDAYPCSSFPLGHTQQREYARRSIYYFQEFLNYKFKKNNGILREDETAYMSMIFIAEAQTFLKEIDLAIESYKIAEQFALGRNDHLIGLSKLYQENRDYENMLEVTSKMMQPERTNPFPRYCNFIDTSMYNDSPVGLVQQLHNIALSNVQKNDNNMMKNFYINKLPSKRFFVVDDFYSNPDEIRNYALTKVEFKQDLQWYKGYRSLQSYHPPGIVEAFENVIGQKIVSFPTGTVNGCFQIMKASDSQVWHFDEQKWAAMIYLSPNAPIESGTRLHSARGNNFIRHKNDYGIDEYFSGNFYDSTKWDIADSAGNFYNRLVIMDAQCVHSAGPYFGDNFENGRLTHLFFFD